MDFDEILCMQYWYLHLEISRTFQQSYGPCTLTDVKILIFLNIFRNNEWILIKFRLCIDIHVYDPCCD